MGKDLEARAVAGGEEKPAVASNLDLLQLRVDRQMNDSFGWPIDRFNEAIPWFDKWLPARFDNLYVLPSIAVQQVRQGDERTSTAFKAACMRG